jgi:hypothetical protein
MHAAPAVSLACPSPSTRCVGSYSIVDRLPDRLPGMPIALHQVCDSDSMHLQFNQWLLPSPHDYIDYRLIVIDCISSFPCLL